MPFGPDPQNYIPQSTESSCHSKVFAVQKDSQRQRYTTPEQSTHRGPRIHSSFLRFNNFPVLPSKSLLREPIQKHSRSRKSGDIFAVPISITVVIRIACTPDGALHPSLEPVVVFHCNVFLYLYRLQLAVKYRFDQFQRESDLL